MLELSGMIFEVDFAIDDCLFRFIHKQKPASFLLAYLRLSLRTNAIEYNYLSPAFLFSFQRIGCGLFSECETELIIFIIFPRIRLSVHLHSSQNARCDARVVRPHASRLRVEPMTFWIPRIATPLPAAR